RFPAGPPAPAPCAAGRAAFFPFRAFLFRCTYAAKASARPAAPFPRCRALCCAQGPKACPPVCFVPSLSSFFAVLRTKKAIVPKPFGFGPIAQFSIFSFFAFCAQGATCRAALPAAKPLCARRGALFTARGARRRYTQPKLLAQASSVGASH